ncbi:NAD(P)/FAD-dependent oxidoreductase [Caballeronia sp. ATUFL_M1_KS5A]|uniref:NAD(P)/FAD-dependent oxidoreductase n=1 Tax=Caballeronia sp. ATUFL_M1_KS5A TaxID=2921778 RepID=UPI0020292690|nr:NAD(P)/FAD-dependent oxidoreductase [Caballeronia sp. ATUFL_M1_KS5A]
MERFDVAIVGQGYAGLTAARLAVDNGLRTVNFESVCFGGLILNVQQLDPPPQLDEQNGAELTSKLAMSNRERGVSVVPEEVIAVSPHAERGWIVETDAAPCHAMNVVIASGAHLRRLGVPGEHEFLGQGVSLCAECDAPRHSDQPVVVVGGGDSAFQSALALAEWAGQVTVVLRGEASRARHDLIERVTHHPRIVLRRHTQVVAIEGAAGGEVEHVRLRSGTGPEDIVRCTGVFVLIGLEPNTGFVHADVARDDAGHLIVSACGETSLAGLWAIGAARSGFGGLLTDAAADAARAIPALRLASPIFN